MIRRESSIIITCKKVVSIMCSVFPLNDVVGDWSGLFFSETEIRMDKIRILLERGKTFSIINGMF